jgi:folate-binding Fe-S cluster repair protein YgfZ
MRNRVRRRLPAALVDLAFHDRVRVTGDDRTTFLQGMLSNDVARLGAGAHAATEFADVDSVASLARILEETAVDFCS